MDKFAFADLLNKYMRRVRANASEVAGEIDVARPTVYRWTQGINKPNKRDKVIACANFLRLTEQETNELLDLAGFLKKEYPLVGDLAQVIFTDFIQKLFAKLLQANNPFSILLLLTQANWGEPPSLEALLAQAKKKYGPHNVLHLKPPYSFQANEKMYFSDLGKQCQFGDINNDHSFETALETKLEKTDQLFVLVSRFEQGVQSLREQLARLLRSLTEMYPHRLHVILCGGEQLADLKYKSGNLSLLNLAKVVHWPELNRKEVYALRDFRFKELFLDDTIIDELLTISGAHPQLLNECLELNQQNPTLPLDKYSQKLSENEIIWQLFMPFKDTEAMSQIHEWLQQENLGKAQPYILNDLLRKLYWKNLLVERGEYLCWRCETLRLSGLEILG
ncbi:hypothetical protein [Candidatus Parabeggiatoa sp. HSG14]|uniref:hypothetical protein n=1 Tax=Candidatus Parabeggiatoa sp. HSG14 TaxID=3055593 RepID=UPI0025A85235|nr:hypothetical protein [Thiotrichales bacterium HSG14]